MRKLLPSPTVLFFLFVVAILLWLILIPLGQMVLSSFRTGHPAAPGPFTLNNYLVAYSSPLTYRMILNTLLFASAGTAITVLIAVAFAWLLERTDMPMRDLCWALLLIPLAMPGLLFSMAYVFLFMPQSGIVNVWLRALFGVFGIEVSEGPINIYSIGGDDISGRDARRSYGVPPGRRRVPHDGSGDGRGVLCCRGEELDHSMQSDTSGPAPRPVGGDLV